MLYLDRGYTVLLNVVFLDPVWQKGTYSLSNYTALCTCDFIKVKDICLKIYTTFYYGDVVLCVNTTAKYHSVRKLWALKVRKVERL